MDKMAENNALVQQGVPVMLVAQPIEEDEINLLDLWRTLYKRKAIVAAVTIAATLIGLAYALLATPVYRVEAKLVPPLTQDVEELKKFYPSASGDSIILKQLGPSVSPKILFNQFTSNFQSISLRRQFFNQHQLAKAIAPHANSPAEIQAVFDGFDSALQISTDEKHPELIIVSWEGDNPEQISEWINTFIAFSLKYSKEQRVLEIMLDKKQQEQSTKRKLAAQLNAAKNQRTKWRTERIRLLKEALATAKQLNIKEYGLIPMAQDKQKLERIPISLAEQPLYLIGSRAIQIELKSLETRKKYTPSNPEISRLQDQFNQLNAIHIDPEKIRVARIDQAAFAPQNPIKPQRKIIVLSALFGGLILGIFIAFISAATARSKQEA